MHFAVLVITDLGSEDEIDVIMAPYSEMLDVPSHPTSCWCIGNVAHREANEAVEVEPTPEQAEAMLSAAKTAQDENNPKDVRQGARQHYAQINSELNNARWAKRQEFIDKHPLKDKPEPDCEECNGTGTRMTEANPNGKWDWYRVGGRYDGWITGEYRESEDNGFNFDSDHEQLEFNSREVSELLDFKGTGEPLQPFAIVGLGIPWQETGNDGVLGIGNTEENAEAWKGVVSKIYQENKGKIGVIVDCHV